MGRSVLGEILESVRNVGHFSSEQLIALPLRARETHQLWCRETGNRSHVIRFGNNADMSVFPKKHQDRTKI